MAVLAACFLLLGGAGCQFLWPNAPTSSEETDKHGAYAGEYTGKWCYQRLNTRMQACYAAIYEAVAEGIDADEMVTVADSKSSTPPQEYHGVKVTLPRQLFSRSEAQTLYVAFTWDNPQFFFISNTYGLTGRNADSYDSISLVFTMNAQERAAAQRQLDRAVNDILADIRPGTYEYGKELTIHDAVAARCRYDEAAAGRGGSGGPVSQRLQRLWRAGGGPGRYARGIPAPCSCCFTRRESSAPWSAGRGKRPAWPTCGTW